MNSRLISKIRSVRRRASFLVLLRGLGYTVAATLATVLVVTLADFLFRFQDVGVRTIFTLAVVGVLLFSLVRLLLKPMGRHLTDLDVALRIERLHPELRDRLASTLQFLQQPEADPLAGSPALRRQVIAQTSAAVENVSLADVLDPRLAGRAVVAALGLIALGAGLIAADQSSATLALRRLANPFSQEAWPRKNELFIQDPVQRLALHQPFEVRVVALEGSRLPDTLRLTRIYDDGVASSEQSEAMQRQGDSFVTNIDQVTRPFTYYATGGDGETLHYQLEVVEPPAVQSLEVALHPPDYIGWPVLAARESIRAIKGTTVSLDVRTDKTLRQATVLVQPAGGEPQSLTAQLHEDKLGFTLAADAQTPFVVEKSGSYWFALEDEEGFPGGGQLKYDIRADADLVPSVDINEPSANIFVTAQATVPLKIVAEDDLALHEIRLLALRSDQSDAGEQQVEVFAVPPPEKTEPLEGTASVLGSEHKFTVTYDWQLAPLELQPGTQITFHATATDFKPQEGKSQPRRLTIITPRELEERIIQRQTAILGELRRALEMQRQSRSQTREMEIQLDGVGEFKKEHIDQLQGAELTQRQVDRTLTSTTEGVTSQIEELVQELENNQVESPEVQRRMQELTSQINRIGKQNLPVIARELTGSIKRAQSQLDGAETAPADDSLKKSVKEVGQQQDQVISSLEGMLDELSQWDNYRRFHGEIHRLKREQDDLAAETAELGKRTVTKDLRDLEPQDKADLDKLSGRQQELAGRFDKIRERMQQIQNELAENDPLASGALMDAVDQAQRDATSGTMRGAGRSLEGNQIGQAMQQQDQVGESLKEMLDILSGRREHELSRLIKKLQEAENQVKSLREKQKGLQKKLDEAQQIENEEEREKELERLTRRQEELKQEAERLARLVRRLNADAAQRSLSKAASSMGKAGQQGQQGDAAGAQQQGQQAEKDLEEAQQQLAQARQQAEADLAAEQMAKIKDALVALRDSQQKVGEDTQRLDELAEEQGKLTRAQLLSLRDVTRQQELVQDQTLGMADKVSAAAVFELALQQAAADMGRAASLMRDTHQTGGSTRLQQQSALRRLSQLLVALEPDKNPDQAGQEDQNQEGEGPMGQQPQQGDGIPAVAQLKLLKLIQEDINARTKDFQEKAEPPQELSEDDQLALNQLSQEQGDLADLAINFLQKAGENPEDDPDSLLNPEEGLDPQPKLKPREGNDPLDKELFGDDPLEKELFGDDEPLEKELFGNDDPLDQELFNDEEEK